MIGRVGSAAIAFDASVTCHCRHHGDLRRSYRAEPVPPPSDVIVVATRKHNTHAYFVSEADVNKLSSLPKYITHSCVHYIISDKDNKWFCAQFI